MAADQPRLGARVVFERARVIQVLGRHRVADARRMQTYSEQAPRPEPRLEHVLDIFGLMAAMKGADADVRMTDLQPRAVIGRPPDRSWQQVAACRVEPCGPVHPKAPITNCS